MQSDVDSTRRARWCSVLVGALALVNATALPAHAVLHFDNGSGGAPAVTDFSAVTLNGTPQLSTATIAPFTVIDDSNTNAGWNLTVQIPIFQNGTGADCATGATASVDATQLTMEAPVVTPADGTTSMTGVTVSGFADFTAPRKIVDAALGDGAGSYSIAPQDMRLTIPANAYAGTYCTDLTLALATGP